MLEVSFTDLHNNVRGDGRVIISEDALFCLYCDGADLACVVESGNSVIHKCNDCGKLHMTRWQEKRGRVVSNNFSDECISVYGEIDGAK